MPRHTTILLVLGLLLGLLVLAPTATPLRVQGATSDAMAPTIHSGDAYVTVPTDGIEEGDVVVFWDPEAGRFFTRLVQGVGDDGYVVGTPADATDAGATLIEASNDTATTGNTRIVPRSAIVAEVLMIQGSLAVLPGVGGFLAAFPTARFAALFLLLVVAVGAVGRSRLARRASGRTVTIRLRTIAVPLLAILFVTCVAITPLSATSYRLTYAVTETGDSGLTVGEPVTREVALPVESPPLTQWVLRGEGVTVSNWTRAGAGINATLSVPPPEEAGQSVVGVHLFPYPEWVPAGLLESAHDIHPTLASLLGATLLVGPLALLYWLLLDGDRRIAEIHRRNLPRYR